MPITDARHYKALLICPNRSIAGELAPLLSYGLPLAPMHEVMAYPQRSALVELIRSFDPKVCFLDFSSDLEKASTAMTDLLALAPAIPVVVLLHGNDPDLILRCLRSGASDFLLRPFTTDQMDAAVEKLARLAPAPPAGAKGGGKVIAVMPAKGASGSTTIACNLAHQSKRLGSKTFLADLDPLTGTVSFLLKLRSNYSFLDVLLRCETLDGDLWKQMITPSQGVDVLLAPENLMDGIEEPEDASPILNYAQRNYETVVVDCGSPYGNWNLSVARLCDELLLVTTNELAALEATQRVLQYFESLRVAESKIRVIVNRYEREAGLNAENIAAALQAEVFQVIPADYDSVQKSLMEGRAIPSNSAFGKNMQALAAKLIGTEEKNSRKEKKASSLSGLLSMFSRASS